MGPSGTVEEKGTPRGGRLGSFPVHVRLAKLLHVPRLEHRRLAVTAYTTYSAYLAYLPT